MNMVGIRFHYAKFNLKFLSSSSMTARPLPGLHGLQAPPASFQHPGIPSLARRLMTNKVCNFRYYAPDPAVKKVLITVTTEYGDAISCLVDKKNIVAEVLDALKWNIPIFSPAYNVQLQLCSDEGKVLPETTPVYHIAGRRLILKMVPGSDRAGMFSIVSGNISSFNMFESLSNDSADLLLEMVQSVPPMQCWGAVAGQKLKTV